jgi:TatD DNase family protein
MRYLSNQKHMNLTDTHTHIYLNEFDSDRDLAIQRALNKGIKYLLLPNIDLDSVESMLTVCKKYPGICFPMIGLHPTSVKSDYEIILKTLLSYIETQKFYAIGETGIDLYWDKTYLREQEKAFNIQMEWAIQYNLPIVIHSRNSLNEIIKLIKDFNNPLMKGIFHCFPGSVQQAQQLIDMGFLLGIGGVVTYKNSGLAKVVEAVDLKHIVLETDAPFLPPVPYRGQRNESAYIYDIATFIANIKNISLNDVANITTQNALELFNLS